MICDHIDDMKTVLVKATGNNFSFIFRLLIYQEYIWDKKKIYNKDWPKVKFCTSQEMVYNLACPFRSIPIKIMSSGRWSKGLYKKRWIWPKKIQ